MTRHCEICGADLLDLEEHVCFACTNVVKAVEGLAPSYKLHILAAALCHSTKEIQHRIGCSASTHGSGLNNAAHATGIKRATLIRAAKWMLRNGRIAKPAGFEDLTPGMPGYEPVRAHRQNLTQHPHPQAPLRVARTSGTTPEPVRTDEALSEEIIDEPDPWLTIDPNGTSTPDLVADEPHEIATELLTGLRTEYLAIPVESLVKRRTLAVMEAEEARRVYEQTSRQLAELMLRDDSLDDVPAFLRVAYRYGLALGRSRALESLEKAS